LNILQATQEIDFDIRNIEVTRCTLSDGKELSFKIVKYEKITSTLGDQLKISLPEILQVGTAIISV